MSEQDRPIDIEAEIEPVFIAGAACCVGSMLHPAAPAGMTPISFALMS
ncbi:hypothetical protein [Methylobacterium sp. E-066]|nr:hypothetical protein [Methylobacterium sp. E-066]MCJ2142794.1 hypothetical protein [Methylobacterium sp. E-066]